MKSNISTFLFMLLLVSVVFPAQRIVLQDLDIVDGSLVISYTLQDLLDDKSVEALQRGIKSEVVHRIELWQHGGIINPLDREFVHRIKVYWDNWEKKYRIESKDENRSTPNIENRDENRLTPNIETVKKKCTTMENYFIANISELDRNQKYRLKLQVDFQLISAESYNAISDIFSGGKKQSQPKKKSGLVSMFVNLVGLGDKEFTFESKDFIINDSGRLQYIQ